jgi:hypothetical protein
MHLEHFEKLGLFDFSSIVLVVVITWLNFFHAPIVRQKMRTKKFSYYSGKNTKNDTTANDGCKHSGGDWH